MQAGSQESACVWKRSEWSGEWESKEDEDKQRAQRVYVGLALYSSYHDRSGCVEYYPHIPDFVPEFL